MSSSLQADPLIPATEAEITDLVCQHAVKCFGEIFLCANEFPSHGTSRTDVAVFTNGELLAIEVKRLDWRRAVYQAYLNRLCFDRSYIALWHTRVSSVIAREAEKWGVGVIGVSPASLEIAVPAGICDPDPVVRSRMVERIRRGTRS